MGRAVPCMQSFQPLQGCIQICPEHFIIEIKSPTACAEHMSLFGNIFVCTGLDMRFFVLLKCVCHMAAGWPHSYLFSVWREWGPVPVAQEGCMQNISLHWLWGESCWSWGPAPYWSQSCSVPSLCEHSVVPSSACVSCVFISTPIPASYSVGGHLEIKATGSGSSVRWEEVSCAHQSPHHFKKQCRPGFYII